MTLNRYTQKTYQIIEAYWDALEIIFKDTIFNPLKQKEYGMMKSSQAEVMFKVLKFICEVHIKDWVERFNVKEFGRCFGACPGDNRGAFYDKHHNPRGDRGPLF